MAPKTIEVTRDALLARRARVLNALGITLEEFRERANAGNLSGDEWDAVSELEEISFLLNDSDDDF